MDKYKINYTFNGEKDINDILINILNKELKKYINMICKNKENELPILRVHLSLDGGKNC